MGWLVVLMGFNWLLHQQMQLNHDVKIWEMVFGFAVFPALLEELAFRGVLLPALESVWGPVRAVAVSAALFAIAHRGGIHETAYVFAVGMLLGWVRWRTGCLWSSVLIHLIHNLAFVVLFLTGD